MDSNTLKEIMEIDNTVRRVVEQLSYTLVCGVSGDKDAIDAVDTMKDRGLVVLPDDIDSRMSECFGRLRELHTNIVDTVGKLRATELTNRDRLDALGIGKADGGTDLGVFMDNACTAVEKVYENILSLMETMYEYRSALDAIGMSMLVTYFTPALLIREATGADGNIIISGTRDGVEAAAEDTIKALVPMLYGKEYE